MPSEQWIEEIAKRKGVSVGNFGDVHSPYKDILRRKVWYIEKNGEIIPIGHYWEILNLSREKFASLLDEYK